MVLEIRYLWLILLLHAVIAILACGDIQLFSLDTNKKVIVDPERPLSIALSPSSISIPSIRKCVDLASKIKSLNISPENIISPKDVDLAKNPKIIDIYDISVYPTNKTKSPEVDGKYLVCRGKAKTLQANYPIEFYLMIENKLEYLILESQGKRKWVFRW